MVMSLTALRSSSQPRSRWSGVLLIGLVSTTAFAASSALGGPFVNLDFEQANVPVPPPLGSGVPVAQAFPGWSARFNNTPVSVVAYNFVGLGEPVITLLEDGNMIVYSLPIMQGRRHLVLSGQSGAPQPALEQRGDLPPDARSLLFLSGSVPPRVTIDGMDLPRYLVATELPEPRTPLRYIWGLDLTPLVDRQDVLLTITTQGQDGGNLYRVVDRLQFSTAVIPEPGAATWLLVALPLLICRKAERYPN
jgi:hypothetical protein